MSQQQQDRPDAVAASQPAPTTGLGPPIEQVPAGEWTREDWLAASTVDGSLSEVDVVALEPEPAVPSAVDQAWAQRLWSFGRIAVWALPAAGIALTVTVLWGLPRPGNPPAGASPGSWLVLTALGLALALLGAVALAALLVPTAARPWVLVGLVLAIVGTVLVGPTLGVMGLARPAVDRLGVSPAFEADLAHGPVLRWLGVGGLVLLGAGWILIGVGVLAGRVLSRVDGYLVLAAVGLAVVAALVATPLLGLATLAMIAAGLGLAWSATRTPRSP